MIRILVADDHPIVREGLKRVVEESADLHVVGEATTGDEVLATLGQTAVDVLLLDLSMPGPGFTALLQRLHAEHPRLQVLVLSVHPEEPFAIRALRAGAAGYLTKDHPPDTLLEAIRRVHGGRRYVTASLAEQLAMELSPEGETPLHRSLSAREYDVMHRLATGMSVKQIAADLELSSKTVSTYRARVLDKLAVESNAALVRYAIEHGLLE
ncbi:MAG TPA: response regulator transcription factor [Gemmatimonadales bacterium]